MQKKVKHICGHDEIFDFSGDQRSVASQRRRQEARLCRDCYAEHCKQLQQKICDWEKVRGLKVLHSYDQFLRQKAADCRYQCFRYLDEHEHELKKDRLFKAAVKYLGDLEQASWWLERQKFSHRHVYFEALGKVRRDHKLKRLAPDIKAEMIDLPHIELKGSPKQQRWAAQIRQKVLQELVTLIILLEDALKHKDAWLYPGTEAVFSGIEDVPRELRSLLQRMAVVNDSVVWIKVREYSPEELALWMKLDESTISYLHRIDGDISFVLNL